MDFELGNEQRPIYGYGAEPAKTYDHKYWMEKARADFGNSGVHEDGNADQRPVCGPGGESRLRCQ